MSKIKGLFKTLENMRMEFYKNGDGFIQVNRQADQNGHHCVYHNADGSQEAEKYISAEEYSKLQSLPRVDANQVGTKA